MDELRFDVCLCVYQCGRYVCASVEGGLILQGYTLSYACRSIPEITNRSSCITFFFIPVPVSTPIAVRAHLELLLEAMTLQDVAIFLSIALTKLGEVVPALVFLMVVFIFTSTLSCVVSNAATVVLLYSVLRDAEVCHTIIMRAMLLVETSPVFMHTFSNWHARHNKSCTFSEEEDVRICRLTGYAKAKLSCR